MAIKITPPPVKYYGGKQKLSKKIISLIPPHKTYVEPFFGGGTVFFAKPKSEVEIINDLNDNVVNFYHVLKDKHSFLLLQEEIDRTLYCETEYLRAKTIWRLKPFENKVLRAWAFFVLSYQSFSGDFSASWSNTTSYNKASVFRRKKELFDKKYAERLEITQIFCRDGLRCIKNTDRPDSFFFLDPPYYNSDMGHYGGYTLEDFKKLLDILSTLKGKFLLTSYPSELLSEYTARNSWCTINNEMSQSAGYKPGKKKTEVFTMNYKHSHSLFD